MTARRITVLGASGFIGRYVVKRLAQDGAVVAACCRHTRTAGYLRTMGDVGQVALFNADLLDERALAAVIAGSDVVINAVGVLYESGKRTFDAVHNQGAARVAALAKAAGVKQLVHISAITADANGASFYARSKAAGEAAVRAAFPGAVILRPSLVFGPEDMFFNRFAALARYLPALPVIGTGDNKFQPVYVDDVAATVLAVIARPDTAGKTYDLAGPAVFTQRQLLELVLSITGRKRLLVTVPAGIASLKAFFLELLPSPLLTRDQVRMMRQDAVTKAGVSGLADLGIAPKALELILPTYLERYRRLGQGFKPSHA